MNVLYKQSEVFGGSTKFVLLVCWWFVGLQIAKQTFQSLVVEVVVFPVREVPDMPRTANICSPGGATSHDMTVQTNRKKDSSLLFGLLLKSGFYLILDPCAFHRLLRENQQKFIIQTNRFINALSNLVASFHILRGIPTTDSLALQIGIEAFDEFLIFTRVADEAGVVLDSAINQERKISQEVLRYTCFAQKILWNPAFRTIERIDAEARRTLVLNGFQSFGRPQINISKLCPFHDGSAEVCLVEVSLVEVSLIKISCTKVGLVKVGLIKVGFSEVGSSKIGFTKVCFVKVCFTKVGSAKVGLEEIGLVEVGLKEVGFNERGTTEIGSEKVGCHERGIIEVGSAEIGFDEIGLIEIGTTEIGTTEIGTQEVGFAEVSVAKVSVAKVGCKQVSFAKISVAEIRRYRRVLLSPCIPII
jgi:hypothetical protein